MRILLIGQLIKNKNLKGKCIMKEKKLNKEYTLQARCTERENTIVEKKRQMLGMKRSDYIRMAVTTQGTTEGQAQFSVKAQELLNYLEASGIIKTKQIERMVDELWNLL